MTSKHSIPLIILHEDGERISNSLTAHHQQLAGSEILITGASGFLMGHVVDALAWMNLHALSSPCRMTLVEIGRAHV